HARSEEEWPEQYKYHYPKIFDGSAGPCKFLIRETRDRDRERKRWLKLSRDEKVTGNKRQASQKVYRDKCFPIDGTDVGERPCVIFECDET
ncbi:unnamed protein product, partial [Pylaiella littoralis]